MLTPGGGGYGTPGETSHEAEPSEKKMKICFEERGSVYEYRKAQESV